jgi:uncharacterized protein YjbI with pentapeptide repeats
MKKNEAIERWNSEEGQNERNSILKRIITKNTTINNLNKTEAGLNDLRGLLFNGISENYIEPITKTRERLYLAKNVTFYSCDLSFSDFSGWLFENCHFENCQFDTTNFNEAKFTACKFRKSAFRKSTFKKAAINLNNGSDSGLIEDCNFNECNFREANFGFPIIRQSIFSNCHLRFCNFDASRFEDVKFEGKVETAFFNGIPQSYSKPLFGFLSSFDPKKIKNEMKNVDFSSATIEDVTFANGIDLATIKWPDDETILQIKHPANFYSNLIEDVKTSNMSQKEKDLALRMIDTVHYSQEERNQSIVILDKKIIRRENNKFQEFNQKFEALIDKLIKKES